MGPPAQQTPPFWPGAAILAVGDSYTFGDVVSDNETWPAILERLTERPVINGGVFGYGVDQSFLRARESIKIYKPETLILGFIPADVARCELSERTGVSKPYFDIKDGRLVLENVPVPPPNLPVVMDLFHRVFGYSFLVDRIMMKKFPSYWLQGGWHAARAHSKGEEVTGLLFRQLSDFTKKGGVKNIYLLVQYGRTRTAEDLAMVDRLASNIDHATVKVIDLAWPLSEIEAKDKKKYKDFFRKHHMTYAGNYFVADYIKETIEGG